MEGELELAYGRVEAQFVEGAPYPPVDPDRLSDHEPRSRLEVAETSQPVELKEPSRAAETARAGDPDPGGNPNPVTFHEYRPSNTLTKKLTNAADMSGADSERDAVHDVVQLELRCVERTAERPGSASIRRRSFPRPSAVASAAIRS